MQLLMKHHPYQTKMFSLLLSKKNALLITEDKDFGELVFRFQLPHKGILLIRMINAKSLEKAEVVLKVMNEHYEDLFNNFSVLDENKIRIRKQLWQKTYT